MRKVAIKEYAYCLNHTPELAYHYGNTPFWERKAKGESEFLLSLSKSMRPFEEAVSYAANQAFIGGIDPEDLEAQPVPWYQNPMRGASRWGQFGEIMPEDEFLALMDISDVFDIIWLEETFSGKVKDKLQSHSLINPDILQRLEKGHPIDEIEREIRENEALPLYYDGITVGCCRKAHEFDECLSSYVLLENIACKAGGVLALLHLLKRAGMKPEEVDFIIECSEEAAGDMNQRGGGNFAKSVGEIAGCINASGCDVRGFCAGPAYALINAAGQVASGIRKNVVVLAGGAVPKLYMNARDHVKKNIPALEDVLGNFAVLLTPEDGVSPVIRLDAIGKHSVGAGASPQAITEALVYEPLKRIGLGIADVDKYAAELQNPEITLPAGAGNVPEANFKMIAALAVMKKELERADMADFIKERGMPGFAPTQGHVPSGVPFIGHACEKIKKGTMKRSMIIGKGSLFLARLTNLSDGASFIIESPSPLAGEEKTVSKEAIKEIILEVLADLAGSLKGTAKE
ncbi:betaine reductase [Acetomicrobium thermoterrenum DSM 13490]|uniref:Betaine reductase n=1 Tax=Acetomicrobium thermoterrenum DSM 13490 TaxID=1120987 RepID=A0A1H3DA66_9BACT|nr:glycine/sarcosine/betaine reductase complex component C subunit beta [Acetomicrobium thermoterrenum]SDX63291.1 betaine reductase [Acetomicrobium thermoterrenum DSM 13490]